MHNNTFITNLKHHKRRTHTTQGQPSHTRTANLTNKDDRGQQSTNNKYNGHNNKAEKGGNLGHMRPTNDKKGKQKGTKQKRNYTMPKQVTRASATAHTKGQ